MRSKDLVEDFLKNNEVTQCPSTEPGFDKDKVRKSKAYRSAYNLELDPNPYTGKEFLFEDRVVTVSLVTNRLTTHQERDYFKDEPLFVLVDVNTKEKSVETYYKNWIEAFINKGKLVQMNELSKEK